MSGDPVVVYGATGYTGKLVAAELAARGRPMVLAGRSAEKLRTLAASVGPLVVDTVAAGLDDAASLREAASRGRVLANCAGPFVRTGEPVLAACAAAGTHYLDTTGEQDWIRRVFEQHADLPVAAVPGMGFDYVPGDLLANLVGNAVAPLRRLILAYHVAGFGMTRGTQHSSLEAMNGRDVGYVDGRWSVGGGSKPKRAFVTFPAPIGRQPVARYPSGEIVTVPRHVETDEVLARLATSVVAPGLAGELMPILTPAIAALLRSPVRGVLDNAIDKLPEGPPEAARQAVRWTIVAGAFGHDGRVARGVVSGPDIYGLTAVTIADGAEAMLAPSFAKTGPLAPAQAYEAASTLDGLASFGVRWSVTH